MSKDEKRNVRTTAAQFWANEHQVPLSFSWRHDALAQAAGCLGMTKKATLDADRRAWNLKEDEEGRARRILEPKLGSFTAEIPLSAERNTREVTTVEINGTYFEEVREGNTLPYIAMIHQSRKALVAILTTDEIYVAGRKEIKRRGGKKIRTVTQLGGWETSLLFDTSLAFLANYPFPEVGESKKETQARKIATSTLESSRGEDLKRAVAWGLITPFVENLIKTSQGWQAGLEEPPRAVLTTRQSTAGLLTLSQDLPTLQGQLISGAPIKELVDMELKCRIKSKKNDPAEWMNVPQRTMIPCSV